MAAPSSEPSSARPADRFAGMRPEIQRRIDAARPATRLAWIAGALFAQRGFGATSIRDIAAAAGVAPSSVYSHFRSKDDLLVAYLNESHEAAASLLRSQMLENAARPPADQVAAIIGFAADRFLAHPGSSVLSRAELRRASPDATATARRMRSDSADFLGDVIRLGRTSGLLRSTEPVGELATVLFSTARQAAAWLHRWPVAPASAVAEALGEFARRIVVGSARVEPVPLPRPSHSLGSSTRDRIVRAAIEHFAASGYTSASLRDIAATVGIRAPSIYEHYASKDQLLAAVVELVVRQRVEVVERSLSRSAGDDVVGRLVGLLRDVVGTAVVSPEAAIAVDADFDHLPGALAAPLAAGHRRVVAAVADLIGEGRVAGRFHTDEPTSVVVLGLLAVAMQTAWLVLEDPRLDRSDVVADAVSYALRILGAEA